MTQIGISEFKFAYKSSSALVGVHAQKAENQVTEGIHGLLADLSTGVGAVIEGTPSTSFSSVVGESLR